MKIGIIGAGNIGSQIARLAVAQGHDVVISNSRGPETLPRQLFAELGDKLTGATAREAAEAGEIVLVAIPLKNYAQVPVEPLAGKVVIDANNYYPQRDGQIPELDDESTTTAELLQAHLPESRVVKGFNHIMAADLTADAQPAGADKRRALIVAGDDPEARKVVADLIDSFGFDPVDIGPLAEGWRIQRDTPGYVKRLTAPELRQQLAEAKRYRDM
ncbi:NADPH-dependent F420 reductase [Streptomyces sp. 7N604]|uniref:NADPH-dependent F420 reductase n=1 Tax=Streptomyces sp. 7N604 TaxID=3457415 RepID=UPI003FD3E875